ncbi:DUF2971 domain-containing protein [Pseudomonas syringae]|uniref:DUF2971 domain-containing protein n=1 Tax=Pseudomonas syringae TaxID=317 RepID=UPI0018A217C4|nr:DUF2971 domain-containing protein [Pseudomonas syringae]
MTLGNIFLGELKTQQIYFASTEELNDPLEGFKSVHWRGDFIIWKNLIKHYLICHARQYLKTHDNDETLASQTTIDINCTIEDFDSELQVAIAEICQHFFSAPLIEDYINIICRNNRIVQKNELEVHFQFFHPITRHIIQTIFHKHGFLNDTHLPKGPAPTHYFGPIIQTVKIASKISDAALGVFFTETLYNFLTHTALSNNWKNSIRTRNVADMYVGLHFPQEFCNALERLMYPSWYVACFMKSCEDASIWGTYGDGHKGICLKYKVEASDEKMFINLKLPPLQQNSSESNSWSSLFFYKVDYGKGHPETNFFVSMARIPKTDLVRYWYKGDNNDVSICKSWYQSLGTANPNMHIENFTHSFTCKLKAWKKEQEYRLVLDDFAYDIANKSSRTVTYSLDNLDGVIFGIRTPLEQKLRTLDIVKELCIGNNIEINVYQAYFDRTDNTIRYYKIQNLNI